MQAISGAGYPGVASMDILDNVIPNIEGEEAKVEWEPRKMLGKFDREGNPAGRFCDLGPYQPGGSDRCPPGVPIAGAGAAKPAWTRSSAALSGYQPLAAAQDLPSTPQPVILVREEFDRPQPRLDRMTGRGMTTVVGRVRPDPLLDYKMVVLSHNTIRGAAGGAIYNGELLVKMGMVGRTK